MKLHWKTDCNEIIWEYENDQCVPPSCRIWKNQDHSWLHIRYCNSKSSYSHVSMNLLNWRKDYFEECNAYHMFSHSFNFIERCSCHWLLNVTLQLAPATAVLELIGQFFCSYTCWNFMSCLHCTQVWCPAVCAKLLNMMFKWIVDKTEVICWFCWLIFDFAMAEIYKCCWLWIQCLGHVNMETALEAHFIHQYIAYICMHRWALSIRILLCHSLSVSDRRVKTQINHFLWQNVHVLRLGFFANTSANPFSAVESARPSSPTTPPPPHADAAAAAAAAAAASVETRACRNGVPGVYEDLRLLVPAVLRRLVR